MGRIKGLRHAAVLLAFMIGSSTNAFGAVYSDVAASHWAYSAISTLADQGIMVGDSTGKYNPNQAVDKFYTAKILAKLSGYKYINLTAEEGLYISRAYDANKSILDQYNKAFSKWDSTADKEIAFLLEKGVLAVTDLNQFAIRLEDGTEKLRALTREEYCAFLVKLMGKSQEANSATYTMPYLDDADIAVDCRPYVYYLRQKNVISGDSTTKFNPKGAVTKATMAVMTEKVYSIMNTPISNGTVNNGTNSVTPPPAVTTPQTTPPSVTTVNSIVGTLYKIYPSLNAVQINVAGTINTYKFNEKSIIYVDGYLRTISDLKEGMTVTGVISNLELAELRAQSISSGTVSDGGTASTEGQPLTKVQGTVSNLSTSAAGETITIKIPSISANGVVTYSENAYAIATDCVVKRDSYVSSIADIQLNEVIYAGVTGNKVHTIDLEKKEVSIKNGKLVSKQYDAVNNRIVISITDDSGKAGSYIINNDSVIQRKGIGECKWTSLRIGDSIELTANYSGVIALYATGETKTVTGWLSEISISNDFSTIKVRDDESDFSTYKIYTVTDKAIDLYQLTLDSKIKVKLDSEEVVDITVIKEGSNKSGARTGFLYTVKSKYIEIVEESGQDDYDTIYIDRDTIIVDGLKGSGVGTDYLARDMEVYVTIRTEGNKKYAKTITIIDYND